MGEAVQTHPDQRPLARDRPTPAPGGLRIRPLQGITDPDSAVCTVRRTENSRDSPAVVTHLPSSLPSEAARRSASESAAAGFLLGRIDYERTPPSGNAAGTFRLARMADLLQRLGDPQLAIPCVHIAGSKGKGSTAVMTASILTAAGRRTGLFTSPHIHRFEERIQIDGNLIPPERFDALVNRLRPVAEEMDGGPLGGPTFFELTTALAWLYFVEQRVEVVVLEVGLGGRLDATNLCRPLVTVITSISRDHTRILGDTLEAIAGEKAGIIKPGVPVLTAVSDPGPLAVIRQRAAAAGAPCHVVGEELRVTPQRSGGATETDHLPRYTFDLETPWRAHRALPVPLPGLHQTRNAALATAAADCLNSTAGLPIPETAIPTGLTRVQWPLRIEVAGERPTLILDAAHNEESIAALVQTLRALPARRRRVVCAISRDKDAAAILRLLADGFDELILTRFLGNPRAFPPAELLHCCEPSCVSRVSTADSPAEALQLARARSGPEDLICVTGSFFLAGEVREMLRGTA